MNNINRKTTEEQSTETVDKDVRTVYSRNYRLTNLDELMEYMWLKPSVTNINVDIFVDDSGSYQRNNHILLLFVRNGYDRSVNGFIPFSIEESPCIFDDETEIHISDEEVLSVLNFIQFNLSFLRDLAERKISQTYFVYQISSGRRNVSDCVSNERQSMNKKS